MDVQRRQFGAIFGTPSPTRTLNFGVGPVETTTGRGFFSARPSSSSSDDGFPDMMTTTSSAAFAFSTDAASSSSFDLDSGASDTPVTTSAFASATPWTGSSSAEMPSQTSSMTVLASTIDSSANTAPTSSSDAAVAPMQTSSSSHAWIAAAVVVPVVVVTAILLLAFFILRRRRPQRNVGHTVNASTGSAGLPHTGRTSMSTGTNDLEKQGAAARKDTQPEPALVTHPASSVQHHYATGIDLSRGSSENESVQGHSTHAAAAVPISPADTYNVHTSMSHPPPYLQAESHPPFSAGPSSRSMTGSNPFTDGSNGSSNALSFSGFSGAGASSNSSRGRDSPREAPAIGAILEAEPDGADGDADAVSMISEGEIVEAGTRTMTRTSRASMIDLERNVAGASPSPGNLMRRSS